MPYTNVSKPTGATYTNVAKPTLGSGATLKAGMTMGLLIPLTNAVDRVMPMAGSYTNVSKPTNSTYTNVAKPT